MLRLHSSKVSSCHHSVTTFCKQQMLAQGLVLLTSRLSTETLRSQGWIAGLTWTGFTGHPHDSGQNEAKRSNAAICETLVDDRALHWEYFQPTDLISEEELKTLTVEEMKELEAEVVERNVWKVAQDFVSRIGGKPGPAGDCMKAFVTNRKFQYRIHSAIQCCKVGDEKSKSPRTQLFQKIR